MEQHEWLDFQLSEKSGFIHGELSKLEKVCESLAFFGT